MLSVVLLTSATRQAPRRDASAAGPHHGQHHCHRLLFCWQYIKLLYRSLCLYLYGGKYRYILSEFAYDHLAPERALSP